MSSSEPSEQDSPSVAIAEKPAPQVVDPPSPFRFGLRALMVFTAICGLQFSLMAYLDILPGLLVGLGLCFVLLFGLVVAAMMFWRGPGTPLMLTLDQLAIRLVVAIFMLAIGSVFAGGGLAIYKEYAYWRKASRIQKELGFTGHSTQLTRKNNPMQGIVVNHVDLGGAFDLAGAEEGDIVLCEKGTHEFYEMIEDNRGKEVNITVVGGGGSQSVENADKRQLAIMVPE